MDKIKSVWFTFQVYILLFWKKVFMLNQLLEQKLANYSLHVLHFPMVFWPADEGWEISFLTVALKSSIKKRKTPLSVKFWITIYWYLTSSPGWSQVGKYKNEWKPAYSYYPECNSSKPVWYTLKVIKTIC